MASDHFSLVVVPAPILDESIASWLMRVGQMHAISPDQLFRRARLKRVSDFDRDLQLEDLEKIVIGTGLGLGAIQCLMGKFKNIRSQSLWRTFVIGPDSSGGYYKYCPHCLASDDEPYWRFTWRLTYYKLCPVHGIELIERCLSCRRPVFPVRRPVGLFLQATSVLCVCPYCDYDWRGAVVKPVKEEGLKSALALQRTITAAILRGHYFVVGVEGEFSLMQLPIDLRKGFVPAEGEWEGYSTYAVTMRALIAGIWDYGD